MRYLILLFICLNSVSAAEVSFERDTSIPLVYLNIAVKTGVVADPKGKQGLTNFLGEMLLRGTKSKSKQQIDLAFDQMGATLETETRAESLILRGAVLSSKLDSFLSLLEELIIQPSFPSKEIKKLKKEIISEILENLSEDKTVAKNKFYRFLFDNHPYGNSILGKQSNIKKIKRADIKKHYLNLFTNEQLIIVGTGDASEKKLTMWANSLSQKLPSNSQVNQVTLPSNSKTTRLQIIDKGDRTQTQIYGGQVGVHMTSPEFFPLYVANHVFGGGSFSARLMTEIRVKRGWSYGAYSWFKHGTMPRSWQFWLFPASKYTPEALSHTLNMIKELRENGITEKEFNFAKQSLINSAGFKYNTPKKRAENILIEKTLNLPEGFMKSFGEKIKPITLEQANSALKRFLNPNKLSIVVLGTAKDLKEDLAKAIGVSPNKVKVVPYTKE